MSVLKGYLEKDCKTELLYYLIMNSMYGTLPTIHHLNHVGVHHTIFLAFITLIKYNYSIC